MSKKLKRVLIVEDEVTERYIINSIKSKFDEIISISDYLIPITKDNSLELEQERVTLPSMTYSTDLNPSRERSSVVKDLTVENPQGETKKSKFVKIKDLKFEDDTAYFVVGKLSWYYIRDFSDCHVGLRNTNLDWQIVHLHPFSMGNSKFVFCHSMTDEHYSRHSSYFFNDDKLTAQVDKLKKFKILYKLPELINALEWSEGQEFGTRFGLDYETNGLYRNDKYEDLIAIGIGIATKDVGYYLELRNLTPDELETFKIQYKRYLDKHIDNIWVFNVSFEMMVTRKLLGPWCTYEFKDADVWRIMEGNQVGYSIKMEEDKWARDGAPKKFPTKVTRDQRWSLKYSAQYYLKVPSWDNEFEHIESKLGVIFNGYKFKSLDELLSIPVIHEEIIKIRSSLIKSDFEVRKSKLSTKKQEDKKSLDDTLIKASKAVDKKLTRLCKDLIDKKTTSKDHVISHLLELSPDIESVDINSISKILIGCKTEEDIVSHPYWIELMSKYSEHEEEFLKWLRDPRFFGNEYAVQPSDIVGRYCILDAYYTVMIAETQYELDNYNRDKTGAISEWASTQKIVEIFSSNKALGGMLDLNGLYKSNIKRDNYNKIQLKSRIHFNYILAKGYNQLLLAGNKLDKSPLEEKLHPYARFAIAKNLDPTNFKVVSSKLLPYIYDTGEEGNWSDSKAKEIFGEDYTEIKEVLFDFYPKGFNNDSAFARSINLHKSTSVVLQSFWEGQDLEEDDKWEDCYEYYNKLGDKAKSIEDLKVLDTFNIKGLTLEEVIDTETFEYTKSSGELVSMDCWDMISEIKRFFDPASASEVSLGIEFERWKEFRILHTLMSSNEYQSEILDSGILNGKETIDDKVERFSYYINKVIDTYSTPKLFSWEEAMKFAINNNFPDKYCSPDQELMKDIVQSDAFIDDVISHDIFSRYKISKRLIDDVMWYRGIDEEMIKNKKTWLKDRKGASPLAYKDYMLDGGTMGVTYDVLKGDGTKSDELLNICDVDFPNIGYDLYPLLTTAFKIYRKYDKLGQYLTGQLVNSDHELTEVDEDGVPKLSKLTKDEKHQSKSGDSVKMFPFYEIMQKATKRNSSGIHTVPSSSEVKGVIVAPEEDLLVYTDIGGMELRGIAGISGDKVMNNYFDSGYDIYVEAAKAYHVDYLGKNMTDLEVSKKYRKPYKLGVISTIYTASDMTLSGSFKVLVHEVRHIKNAIFDRFRRLYEWQQEQITWNKKNRGRIRSYMGDIIKTFQKSSKQDKQSINYAVQGTCSLIATRGFCNIITAARKIKMLLTPAVIVHDAIVAYAKAKDLEKLYDHYQESFYDFLNDNYGFKFPFDLEIAPNYFDKTILTKGSGPREFKIVGSNRAVHEVLSRACKQGKEIEFINSTKSDTLESVKSKIDSGYSILDQYFRTGGLACFDRDFSYGEYEFKFVD